MFADVVCCRNSEKRVFCNHPQVGHGLYCYSLTDHMQLAIYLGVETARYIKQVLHSISKLQMWPSKQPKIYNCMVRLDTGSGSSGK